MRAARMECDEREEKGSCAATGVGRGTGIAPVGSTLSWSGMTKVRCLELNPSINGRVSLITLAKLGRIIVVSFSESEFLPADDSLP
ncbi:hypothetical protein OGATHE_002116 [Ogataea polymorpha]|uniref:Uncharacterized protein n=1 Tax=Ogataea polymorpha TaxID=460523 RepID=A0A9P8TDB9_9ASCO|nr:hypothetical protein OGATHE_002116 [Ogataea polymorpha]